MADDGTDLFATTLRQALVNRLARQADEIAQLFRRPMQVTIIVRDTTTPDGSGDMWISSELEPQRAIAALERLIANPNARPARNDAP